MKWIFFILLLANLGVFVWIYPQINRPGPEVVQPTGTKSLLLLSELDDSSIEFMEQVETTIGEEYQVESETEVGLSVAEELVLPKLVPEQKEVEGERLYEMDFPTPVEPLEVQDEAPPLIAAESLETQDLVLVAEAEMEPFLHCRRVGPLAERVQADQLSLRLRAIGLEPDLISELSNNQEGYWVLVPPQKNRAVAVRIVRRLKEAGISDLWRFTSGNLAHAISLGLFRDVNRAEIRRKSIENKGFDVEVRPRYRQKTLHWLSFSYFGDSPITQDKWNDLLNRYPEIEQRNVDCQEIASQ